MRRATTADNQAGERPIYVENVSRTRETVFRALRVDGNQRIPSDPAEESWNSYGQIPLVPPEGLVPNGGPGGAPVELVALELERISKLKWGPAAGQSGLPPLPPGTENQLCRVIPPNFGEQDGPPGAYAPTLVGGPPFDGNTWVVDGMNHIVEFPYGPPPEMDPDGLTLFFYRYTGPTGGLGLWHYSDGVLCPDPGYPGAAGGDLVAPLPAQSTEGPGLRLMITRDGCIRAGVVDGSQWDAPNRGANSAAFGLNNTAAGDNSAACGGSGNAAAGAYSVVGGGADNSATEPYASVAGGANNLSDSAFATVGGGQSNLAMGYNTTIGGGIGNYAGDQLAFIGGGYLNAAGFLAVAAGGQNNSATGQYSAVGGGINNQALGTGSVVPGGTGNTAAGAASFAAGTNASADHDGSYVWGDSTGGPTVSIGDNSWVAGASGGVIFWTDPARVMGASLAPSASSWASVCDRRAKENIVPLDSADILRRVGELPLYEYNYCGMSPGAKYRGPMAQDWHRLFPTEKDQTRIETLDFDGVALGAIQGLLARMEALTTRVEHLEGLGALGPASTHRAGGPESGATEK